MKEYLDEFDEACLLVGNDEPLPILDDVARAACTALCRIALNARLNYAMLRQVAEDKNPDLQIGAQSFIPESAR